MAKIEHLISQVPDERLRKAIATEIKALKRTKKFGLVFEEHLPETVRLPLLPVREGSLVALKRQTGNDLWRVKAIRKGATICDRAVEGYPAHEDTSREFPITDLVAIRNFGDPIYPAMVPVDRVQRAGADKPWHAIINADNFHALQLLLYCYESQVDAQALAGRQSARTPESPIDALTARPYSPLTFGSGSCMARHASLVSQHLENISRQALEKYQRLIRQYVRNPSRGQTTPSHEGTSPQWQIYSGNPTKLLEPCSIPLSKRRKNLRKQYSRRRNS